MLHYDIEMNFSGTAGRINTNQRLHSSAIYRKQVRF